MSGDKNHIKQPNPIIHTVDVNNQDDIHKMMEMMKNQPPVLVKTKPETVLHDGALFQRALFLHAEISDRQGKWVVLVVYAHESYFYGEFGMAMVPGMSVNPTSSILCHTKHPSYEEALKSLEELNGKL